MTGELQTLVFDCGCSREEAYQAPCKLSHKHGAEPHTGCYVAICEKHQRPGTRYQGGGWLYDPDASNLPYYKLNLDAFPKFDARFLPFCDIPLRDEKPLGVSFDY